MQITWQSNNLVIKPKNCTVIFFEDSLKINDFTITSSGEYEVGGVAVKSFNGLYLFHIENIPLAYLPSIESATKISSDVSDELSQAEILILNLVDYSDKSAKEIADLISKIDPKCFIPIAHTNESEVEISKQFNVESVNEIKLTSIDLPEEGRNTILMVCPKIP